MLLRTPRHHHRRRHRERGQVLPIIALSGVVLIGVTALAVDLSLQTNTKRQIQNVADAAALAGAHDLYSSGSVLTLADQTSAASDALATVRDNMGWSIDLPDLATACPSGYPTTAMLDFGMTTGVCLQYTYGGDSVTVSTPPMSPDNVVDVDNHDMEVDITQHDSTNFAAVIGFASSSEKAHAVARHGSPGVTTGFALFSNRYIETGNQISVINGNVYAGRAVNLQSGGQAAFCANDTAAGGDGYIFLGAPQHGDNLPGSSSGGQWDMLPTTSNPIVPRTPYLGNGVACTVSDMQTANFKTSNLLGYVVQAGSDVQGGSPTCPSISGAGTALYDHDVGACEVPPIVLPPAPAPPIAGNVRTVTAGCRAGHVGAGCWSSTPTDGLYIIQHNTSCLTGNNCYDLRITGNIGVGPGVTPPHITIWLKPGATFAVNSSGSGNTVLVAGPYNAGTGQSGDGRYVVYGESGSWFGVTGASTSVEFQTGSIVMPSGTVSCTASNADLTLDSGQAVADTWDVQSGNHINPQITYNAAYAGVSTETLRLVE